MVKTETLAILERYPVMILLTKTFHVQTEKKRFKKNIIAAFRLPDFSSKEEKQILNLLSKKEHEKAVDVAVFSKNWETRLKFGVKLANPKQLEILASDPHPEVAIISINKMVVIMQNDPLVFHEDHILDFILGHKSSEVRKLAFNNFKLNKARLLMLAKDDDFNVSSKAIKILSSRGLSQQAYDSATNSSNKVIRSHAIQMLTRIHLLIFLQMKDLFFRLIYLFKI